MIAPPAFIHPPALGGQYGQHNPDHHCSSVACRRRFLWPRTVVLPDAFGTGVTLLLHGIDCGMIHLWATVTIHR
jgi:hypothetical protein